MSESHRVLWQLELSKRPGPGSDHQGSSSPEFFLEIVDGGMPVLGLPLNGEEACTLYNAVMAHSAKSGVTFSIDVGMLNVLPGQLQDLVSWGAT